MLRSSQVAEKRTCYWVSKNANSSLTSNEGANHLSTTHFYSEDHLNGQSVCIEVYD